MAKAKGLYARVAHEPIFHKTSIGRNPSLCKMNKSKRKNFKKYRGQGRWHYPKISYIVNMKEKIITIKVKSGSAKQYSNLLLELNLIKQAWRSYGVDLQLNAPSLKATLTWGTSINDTTTKNRQSSD